MKNGVLRYVPLIALLLAGAVIIGSLWMASMKEADLSRTLIAVTVANSIVLGSLTFLSVEESRRMAEASEKQATALKAQLELETAPKLILVPYAGSRSEYPLSLVNFSKLPIWIELVQRYEGLDEPPLDDSLGLISADDLSRISTWAVVEPGSWVHIGWSFDYYPWGDLRLRPIVKVKYLYPPTGAKRHRAYFRIGYEGKHPSIVSEEFDSALIPPGSRLAN